MPFYKFFLLIMIYHYFQTVHCIDDDDVGTANVDAGNVLCKKCYCKNLLINSVPELQVTCSFLKLTDTFNTKYNNVHLLDYSHNKIKDLIKLSNCENLATYNLSYNEITSLTNDMFNGLSNLITLDLSHNFINHIDYIFDNNNMMNLKVLHLEFNNLKTIPEDLFLPLRNLIELDLSYNKDLVGIITDKQDLIGLNENLKSLKLNGLNITHIPNNFFNDLNQLEVLWLADNRLNQIPVLPLNITNLDLSGNNLTELILKYLSYRNLKTLKLNRMKNLRKIHPYAFYELSSLEELSIEDCPKLRQLTDNAFMDMDNDVQISLKKFSVAGSALEDLNKTWIHLFISLDSIDLRNNPWKCSCKISWLQMVQKRKFVGVENLLCSTEKSYLKQNIMQMSFDACGVRPTNKLGRIVVPILVILIILLLMLILYLCHLNPIKYGGFPVGPQSPYQRVVVESH